MYLVHDAVADASQCVIGKSGPVGGHRVFRGDCSDRADATVGSVVSHHADSANGQEDGEVLPDAACRLLAVDLFAHHGIGASQQIEVVPRDLADDAHRETRTGEGLALDDFRGQTERATDLANFVLEEKA